MPVLTAPPCEGGRQSFIVLGEPTENADHPKAAIYLDEVQEVPEWQRLVRALLDSGRRVCLTGSNASLLGRETEDSPHPSHGQHEFGNAETYFLVGDALGKGMLKRLPK